MSAYSLASERYKVFGQASDIELLVGASPTWRPIIEIQNQAELHFKFSQ